MPVFKPVNKLSVYRTLFNGTKVLVGVIAQNKQAIYFQYDNDYINNYPNLSPFKLAQNTLLQQAPSLPHKGLHGVFADSLPDGWGTLLMDRVFRQQNIQPHQLTNLDRLAYIANRGTGALSYKPVSPYQSKKSEKIINLSDLAFQAQQIYQGQTNQVLQQLANAGSSGGARPKAQLYFKDNNFVHASTVYKTGLQPWLVKFTSQSLPLGHQEGLCEAAYLTIANNIGLNTPKWRLITNDDTNYLALKRFDYTSQGGRTHMHSLCGLLDANYQLPSLDYEDIIKASQILCNNPAVGQQQFVKAVFNLFALNQDDHSKNWAFLQNDKGQWQPSPFYDVTFSPNPAGEHSTAYGGYGKQPSIKAMQNLAVQANFANWNEAKHAIQKVLDGLSQWQAVANDLGVNKNTQQLIAKQLGAVYKANKQLCV